MVDLFRVDSRCHGLQQQLEHVRRPGLLAHTTQTTTPSSQTTIDNSTTTSRTSQLSFHPDTIETLYTIKFLFKPQLEDFSYELAPNWHLTHIYSNRTARLLSLDLNAVKRKLYWFEFDRATHRWSLGLLRLFNPMARSSVTYHGLNAPFSADGYSYLAVASDSAVFISNNQSLILCHLDNETCVDYFRPVVTSHMPAQSDGSLVISHYF